MKYIIITSGIINHIGKHSLTSSIGLLLKHFQYKPTLCYINPYLNNETQYLLNDGTFVREEIGVIEKHWECNFSQKNIITLDKIIQYSKEHRFRTRSRNGSMGNININEIGNIPIGMERNHNIRLFKEGLKSFENLVHTIPDKKDNICLILLDGLVESYDNYFWLKSLREFQKNHSDSTYWIHTCLLTKHSHTKNHTVYTTRNVAENINILRGQQIKVNGLILRTKDKDVKTHVLDDISEHTEIPVSDMYVSHNMIDSYSVPIHLYNQQLPQSIINKLGGNIVFTKKIIQRYNRFIKMIMDSKTQKVKIAVLCPDETVPIKLSKNFAESIRHAMYQIKCIPDFFMLNISTLKHKNDEMIRNHIEEYNGFLTFSDYWHGIENEAIRIFRILRTSQKKLLSFGDSHQIVTKEMVEFYKMLKLNKNHSIGLELESEPDIVKIHSDKKLNNQIINTNRRGILHRTMNNRNINITYTPRIFIKNELLEKIKINMKELIEIDSYENNENTSSSWIMAVQDKSSPFYFSTNYLPYTNSNIIKPSKIIYQWLKNVMKN
jgi:CTP synthase (UTP-ammonia lyase)